MSLAAHPVSLIFVVIILTYIDAMIGLRWVSDKIVAVAEYNDWSFALSEARASDKTFEIRFELIVRVERVYGA